MKLVIGGYAQGKLGYAMERYGVEACQVWNGRLPGEGGPGASGQTVIINHVHELVKASLLKGGCPEEEIRAFVRRCPDCVMICDEIGNGIVPVEALEREYRERTGRILVELAKEAQEVVRVICGIGQKIK